MPPAVLSRITSHQSGSIFSGSTVDLSCEAKSGTLPISYIWTDPKDQALSPGDTDGRVSFTLIIYGTYTCTATNGFGVDTSTIELMEPGTLESC